MNDVAVQLALRNQAIPALPAAREFENTKFTAPADADYVEEDYVPGTARLRTATAAGGTMEHTGYYVLRWIGLRDTRLAMSAAVTALLARFPAGSALTAADGTVVRIRGDIAPRRGQLTNRGDGRPVITIEIPWLVLSINPL